MIKPVETNTYLKTTENYQTVNALETSHIRVNIQNNIVLTLPPLSTGLPKAGKKIAITPPEYEGTRVYHTAYLPENWSQEKVHQGQTWPIIFEYTENKYPKSGSTGEVKDAAFGFGLSAGKFIWISLPYIHSNKMENQLT
ncbi:hypothetical protein L3081_20975 [Colwellia sp. MSW7]|uniref:Uncharacterized protein n=1 Tax=Colwellia maritima TaxID=2912588 RepID=A0ABS9X5A1_9GAMM|nr:hypothetical protein [Colwellia maritima]MCI2285404.1 hypothetical protein [Colwellia maritima]